MDYVMLENKEGKMLTKKLFLGLGGLAVAAVPVMSVISCGANTINNAAEAVEVEENGIYVNKETGYITKYTGAESVVTIPAQIQGVTIKGVGTNAFKNNIFKSKMVFCPYSNMFWRSFFNRYHLGGFKLDIYT